MGLAEKNALPGLQTAIARAGSQANLAKHLGVTRASVSHWINVIGAVPLDRCRAIEEATGVPCDELRSDVHWVRDHTGVIGYLASVESADGIAPPAYVAQCIRNQAAVTQESSAVTHVDVSTQAEAAALGERVRTVVAAEIERALRPGGQLWRVATAPIEEAAEPIRSKGSALDAHEMATDRPSAIMPVSGEPFAFLVERSATVGNCLTEATILLSNAHEIFEHECEEFTAATYGAWQLMEMARRLVGDAHLKLMAYEGEKQA